MSLVTTYSETSYGGTTRGYGLGENSVRESFTQSQLAGKTFFIVLRTKLGGKEKALTASIKEKQLKIVDLSTTDQYQIFTIGSTPGYFTHVRTALWVGDVSGKAEVITDGTKKVVNQMYESDSGYITGDDGKKILAIEKGTDKLIWLATNGEPIKTYPDTSLAFDIKLCDIVGGPIARETFSTRFNNPVPSFTESINSLSGKLKELTKGSSEDLPEQAVTGGNEIVPLKVPTDSESTVESFTSATIKAIPKDWTVRDMSIKDFSPMIGKKFQIVTRDGKLRLDTGGKQFGGGPVRFEKHTAGSTHKNHEFMIDKDGFLFSADNINSILFTHTPAIGEKATIVGRAGADTRNALPGTRWRYDTSTGYIYNMANAGAPLMVSFDGTYATYGPPLIATRFNLVVIGNTANTSVPVGDFAPFVGKKINMVSIDNKFVIDTWGAQSGGGPLVVQTHVAGQTNANREFTVDSAGYIASTNNMNSIWVCPDPDAATPTIKIVSKAHDPLAKTNHSKWRYDKNTKLIYNMAAPTKALKIASATSRGGLTLVVAGWTQFTIIDLTPAPTPAPALPPSTISQGVTPPSVSSVQTTTQSVPVPITPTQVDYSKQITEINNRIKSLEDLVKKHAADDSSASKIITDLVKKIPTTSPTVPDNGPAIKQLTDEIAALKKQLGDMSKVASPTAPLIPTPNVPTVAPIAPTVNNVVGSLPTSTTSASTTAPPVAAPSSNSGSSTPEDRTRHHVKSLKISGGYDVTFKVLDGSMKNGVRYVKFHNGRSATQNIGDATGNNLDAVVSVKVTKATTDNIRNVTVLETEGFDIVPKTPVGWIVAILAIAALIVTAVFVYRKYRDGELFGGDLIESTIKSTRKRGPLESFLSMFF